MSPLRLLAAFDSADDYLAAHDQEVTAGGLLVRGAELPPGTPLGECTLVVQVAGAGEVELPARLAGAAPGQGVMVIFLSEPAPLLELAARLRAPEPEPGPERAPREMLGMSEKFRLATSGEREQRFQLLRDPNKQLHVMVLKNPRITLEEVQYAARLATLNPEALKAIADHPEWGQNPTIATSLVRNPKTPVPVALKLLPRLPVAELRAIAKSQGRAQIVQGARKLLAR